MLSAIPLTSRTMSSRWGVMVLRPSRESRRIALINRSIFCVEEGADEADCLLARPR